MRKLLLGLSLLSSMHAAVAAEKIVFCQLSGLYTDKNQTDDSGMPFRERKSDFEVVLKGDELLVAERDLAIPNSPYIMHAEFQYFPKGVTPYYSSFIISATIRKKLANGAEHLMGIHSDMGSSSNVGDSNSSVVALIDWYNQDLTNHIVDLGYTLNEALLIPVDAEALESLLASGKIPNDALLGADLNCRYAPN